MIYQFGAFTLDSNSFDLKSGSQPIRVEPQVFGVLQHLIENRDRVVTKET